MEWWTVPKIATILSQKRQKLSPQPFQSFLMIVQNCRKRFKCAVCTEGHRIKHATTLDLHEAQIEKCLKERRRRRRHVKTQQLNVYSPWPSSSLLTSFRFLIPRINGSSRRRHCVCVCLRLRGAFVKLKAKPDRNTENYRKQRNKRKTRNTKNKNYVNFIGRRVWLWKYLNVAL